MTLRTVAITPGSGDSAAFDDNWQVVKLTWGPAGTGNLLDDASGKRLPVALNEVNVTVPVSGTVGVSGTVAVSGPLTDAQLRASAVPVSAASLPLPTGAATAAKQPALGTAGSAAADVLTIQGIASMTAVKVDGSAVTQPVSGTVTVQDGGGSITVDGTVAATQSGTWTIQPGNTANTTPWLATISQGGNAATVSAGGALKVDGSAATQPVSGTVTADTELPAAASITATGNSIPSTVIVMGATGVYNGTTLDLVQSGAGDAATSAQKLPTTQFAYNGSTYDRIRTAGIGDAVASTGVLAGVPYLFNGSTFDRGRSASIGDGAAATGLQAKVGFVFNGSTYDRMRGDTANGLDVDVTRVGGTVTTKETRAATSGVTSVAASATSVTVLASNANRLAATVFNDSTALLYLKLGATASSTSHTVQIQPNGYYEVPGLYTGIIDGIWASATGNARVTELTA